MFKAILYPLVTKVTPFNIFQYITFRAAYAAITALLLSFLFGPAIIRLLTRFKAGQAIRLDGPQTHQAKSGTPTMGGLLIIPSVLLSTILWQDLKNRYVWIVLISMAGFGLIGFIDDYLKVTRRSSGGMKALIKITGQTCVATVVVIIIFIDRNSETTLLYLPFFKKAVVDLSYLYIPFAVVLIVGMSNAVNLTDGLDGLATGLVLFVAVTFTVLSYITGRVDFAEYLQIPFLAGSGELSVVSFALTGAGIGFLWYNSQPAELFMGDTGSLALGGVFSVISLLIKKEILLVIVGGVFVLEAFSVIIQVGCFKATGRRVFRMAPLHHHFEMKGWKESKVVTRFWILGILFMILGLSTLKLQ